MTRCFSLLAKSKRKNSRLLTTAVALVSLATVSLASASPVQGPTDLEPRIVGGTDTKIKKWPSAVFLKIYADNGNIYNCGGNLIAADWLMN